LQRSTPHVEEAGRKDKERAKRKGGKAKPPPIRLEEPLGDLLTVKAYENTDLVGIKVK